MNKEYLQFVLGRLEELKEQLYLKYLITNKRKREQEVCNVKSSISDFTSQLSSELKDYMERVVGVNALNYQWMDSDIESYINELKKLINASGK